jgi:hypothetical protein
MTGETSGLYARSEYGKGSFDYRLFRNKPICSFKSFILRSSADDALFIMYTNAPAICNCQAYDYSKVAHLFRYVIIIYYT